MKNRNYLIILCFTILMCLLIGCGNRNKQNESIEQVDIQNEENEKISIVCTIFPQYDWVREIIGDDIDEYDLTLLLDDGVDLHSYQPTAQDVAKIADCDLFVYVGGESDGWVDDALKEATNKNMQVINMMEVLGNTVKEEELVEGMESGEDENDKEESNKEEETEEVEYDEHVWLSLKNATTITNKIIDAICSIDTKNENKLRKNGASYIQKLSDLDGEYQNTVKNSVRNTILFGDRFPFRYMIDDYKLDYYAAFVGCSAETEASFNTIVFLSSKMDELKLPAVLVIDQSNEKIAKTIIENTQEKTQKILEMNSMQSVTGKNIEEGTNYLDIMQENLKVLKQALN